MSEVEIERMLIRLVGDGSSFQTMMKTAITSSQQAATAIQQAGKQIEGIKNSIEGFARAGMNLLAGFGVATSLKGAFEAYSKLEDQQIKMRSVMEGTGRDVEQATADYKEFASAISKVTMSTKGQVMAMLSEAEVRGLQGEKAQDAIKLAIALSGVNNQSTESNMHLAMGIMEGNTHMLKRGLRLHNVKDNTELMTKATDMLTKGFDVQQAKTGTAFHQIEKLGTSLKELSGEMGKIVSEAIKPVVEWMGRTVEQFKALDDATKATAVKVLLFVAAVPLVVPALRGLAFVIGTIVAPIKSIISFAVNLALSFANLAISIVSVVAKFIVQNTLMTISRLLWFAWTGVVLAAKVAVMAFNAVMIVTEALAMGGPTVAILALTIAVVAFIAVVSGMTTIIVAPFAAFGAASYLAYSSIVSVITALAALGTETSAVTAPIEYTTSVIKEWEPIIAGFVRAIKVDLPLAWDIAEAAGILAIEEIKSAWKPLWILLRDGFLVLSAFIKVAFSDAINEAIETALTKFAYENPRIAKMIGIDMTRTLLDIDKRHSENRARNLETTKLWLDKIGDEFKVTESESEKEARMWLDIMMDEIPEAEAKALRDGAEKFKMPKIPQIPPQTVHVTLKATLAGSAEALANISRYRDALLGKSYGLGEGGFGRLGGTGASGGSVDVKVGAAPGAGGESPIVASSTRQEGFLSRIAEAVEAMARNGGITIEPVGLPDG